MTFKPTPKRSDLPLAGPACEVLQAVGGAELNVAVAFAKSSGTDTAATWVSILPSGPLGNHVEAAARAAKVSTSAVLRDDTPYSTLGTLHVVDDGSGPRPQYQRHQSAFCSQAGRSSWDWDKLFRGVHWYHSTGITPLLGTGPRAAWDAALEAAADAKRTDGPDKLHVSVDLNHRPALGSLEELWASLEPHLTTIDLLILSEDTLKKLAAIEGVWPAGQHPSEVEALSRALESLREHWKLPMVGCCFKRPLRETTAATAAAATADGSDGKNKNTLVGGNGVRRWSVVATARGVASTSELHTEHEPVEALGGGDAWLAGFAQYVLEARGQGLSSAAYAEQPVLHTGILTAACRRGDILAALQMSTFGDLSDVDRAALLAVEQRWKGAPARLVV
jgi:sugar/nucleoside kinase (ribokinase family)